MANTRQLGFTFETPTTAAAARHVWPVRELVSTVRTRIERDYADVWVEGEISNYRPAPSGHVYFTLKDADAQLPIVLFRSKATLLRFRPQDGLHVLVRGKVTVYEQRGQMQLVAETMEPVGTGSLQMAFEQLKEKLKGEGLFDQARKRSLPAFPRTVGIVTSPTGAVIRDFLNIVGRRHSGLNVLLYPVSVQGEQAPAEIEQALSTLNESQLVDVIVVARGGGSLEDLAAFNSERVARAIAASKLPVVSAVGHETDFTIADFVADLRAPTPSAAAELITDAQYRIGEELTALERRLERAMRYQLLQARQHLNRVPAERMEARIAAMVQRRQQRLDELGFRMEAAVGNRLRAAERRVAVLNDSVLRHDPRALLARTGDRLRRATQAMEHIVERRVQLSRVRLTSLEARLSALSPLAVLDRGYALVLDENGRLLHSAQSMTPGMKTLTRLSDGVVISHVDEVTTTSGTKEEKP